MAYSGGAALDVVSYMYFLARNAVIAGCYESD